MQDGLGNDQLKLDCGSSAVNGDTAKEDEDKWKCGYVRNKPKAPEGDCTSLWANPNTHNCSKTFLGCRESHGSSPQIIGHMSSPTHIRRWCRGSSCRLQGRSRSSSEGGAGRVTHRLTLKVHTLSFKGLTAARTLFQSQVSKDCVPLSL